MSAKGVASPARSGWLPVKERLAQAHRTGSSLWVREMALTKEIVFMNDLEKLESKGAADLGAVDCFVAAC